MTEDHFARLRRLFQEARHLDAAGRAEYLQRECHGDESLSADVEALLREHDGPAREFLESPAMEGAFERASSQLAPQTKVGSYRILELVGEGGMGVVYRAEQDHPRRTVALKLIRPGLGTTRLLKRFEREADVLGHLHHPGIAQIFEAGVREGMPFIAMEWVDGPHLLEYVNQHDLSRRCRLELFLQICEAVRHAHQRGVIHRDLKPGNILVEGEGEVARPRILDFGVARMTDTDLQRSTLGTSVGELIGTVQYMSPEQASGDPDSLDTRSDVYSLGVILFELLSGRLPYDLRGTMVHEATRVIRDEEPTTLGSIDTSFRGDLETIVSKALEKEQIRRYASVADLATDVQHHLDDEPINARPPTGMYQLRKFARRNRTLVVGIVTAFLGLLVGLIGFAWKWHETELARSAEAEARRKAESRFEDVRQLALKFVFDFHDQIAYLPGTLEARRQIVSTALSYLDRLASEAPENEDLLWELAAAYSKVGDIQGQPNMANIGDTEGALESYRKQLSLLGRIGDSPDHIDRLTSERVNALLRIGDVYLTMGEEQTALQHYSEAQSQVLRDENGRAASDQALHCMISTSHRLGDILRRVGRSEEALEQFRLAADYTRERSRYWEATPEKVRTLAVSKFKVATALEQLNRLDEALATYRECLASFRENLDSDPANIVWRRDVGTALDRIGMILMGQGILDEALLTHEEALTLRELLVGADPTDAQARADLWTSINRVGEVHLQAGRIADARENFDRALEIAAELARNNSTNYESQRSHAVAIYKLSELHRSQGQDETLSREQRLDHWQRALSFLQQTHAIFTTLEEQGLLTTPDRDVPDELATEITCCERTIAILAGS